MKWFLRCSQSFAQSRLFRGRNVRRGPSNRYPHGAGSAYIYEIEKLEPRIMLTTSRYEIYAWSIVNLMRENPPEFARELEGMFRGTISNAHGYSNNDPIWQDLRDSIQRSLNNGNQNFWAALQLMKQQPRLGPLAWSDRLEGIAQDHNDWMQTHCYAHSGADAVSFGTLPGYNQPGINGDPDLVGPNELGPVFVSDRGGWTYGENIGFSTGSSLPRTRSAFGTGTVAHRQREAYADIIGFITEISSDSLGHLRNLLSRDRTSDDFSLTGTKNKEIGFKNAIGIDYDYRDIGLTDGTTNRTATHSLSQTQFSHGGGFVAGLAYEDTNRNGHYDANEGIHVDFSYESIDGTFGGGSATSADNFGLISEFLSNGQYIVTVSGGGRVFSRQTVTINNNNVAVTFLASSGFGLTDDSTPSLVSDLYEPNDLSSQAINLGTASPGSPLVRAGDGLSIHTSPDKDWFTFAVTGNAATANIFVGFQHANGDIDARLHRQTSAGSLELVASRVSSTDDELFASLRLTPGIYYLEIYGFSGATNFYSLSLDVRVNSIPIYATAADAGGGPHLRIFDSNSGAERFSFFAYDSNYKGGVRIASGDINGDGWNDIITSPGPGGGPHVRVFSGADGAVLYDFMAFDPGFTGGIFVASGDVTGDGQADIIVSADAGGGPHVKVFSGVDGSLVHSFFAYSASFFGGVRIGVSDVNGDGFDDIVTGPGAGGGPNVRVFSGRNLSELASFFAYAPNFIGGIYVAGGDTNDDGRGDIITGPGAGGGPNVRVFSGRNLNELTSFFAYNANFFGGVRVASTDRDGDGKADIITAPGPGGGPHVRLFSGENQSDLGSFMAYSPNMTGGVFVTGGSESMSNALLAVNGPFTPSEGSIALTSAQLRPFAVEAQARWQQADISDDELEVIAQLEAVIMDLPSMTLGFATENPIFIDPDAGGFGWFIHPTPQFNEEFQPVTHELIIIEPNTTGRFDLLTALLHEYGHHLGFDHPDYSSLLMSGMLERGIRRIQARDDFNDFHQLFADQKLLDQVLM